MVCATEIIMTPFTLIISEFFMLINQISKYIYIYENMISFYTKWESIKKKSSSEKERALKSHHKPEYLAPQSLVQRKRLSKSASCM